MVLLFVPTIQRGGKRPASIEDYQEFLIVLYKKLEWTKIIVIVVG